MKSTGTVFLIDDDPAVRQSLALLLEQQDLLVESFEGGAAFLANFHPVLRSCAIVDIRMPGMSGLQLQLELAQRSIRLPVIVLTGHGDIPTAVSAVKLGAIEFLTKPVPGEILFEAVHNALTEKRAVKRTGQGKREPYDGPGSPYCARARCHGSGRSGFGKQGNCTPSSHQFSRGRDPPIPDHAKDRGRKSPRIGSHGSNRLWRAPGAASLGGTRTAAHCHA
jgi:ActR/RegA family two-component response regulator